MRIVRSESGIGFFYARALTGVACLLLCAVAVLLCAVTAMAAPKQPPASPTATGSIAPAGTPVMTVGMTGTKRWMDSAHFRYYYDAGKETDVPIVEQSAEAAYARLTSLLRFVPKQRIPVVLYAKRAEFQKDARVSRTELVVGTASSADEAIRLDASKIFDAPDRVIGHETTHIFLFQMLGNNVERMPLWLNEGLAQEIGGADPSQAHAIVADALTRGQIIPLTQLEHSFPPGDATSLAYAEAQDATGDLLGRGGWPKMRELIGYLELARPFDQAMRSVYGLSAVGWDRRWSLLVRLQERSRAWMIVAEWLVPILMFIALVWGGITVRRHRVQQVREEEPMPDLEPPSWWREEDFR